MKEQIKKEQTKRLPFQLFQTPLDLAHAYWQKLLKTGDRVVDATCGNGHDTLFLAKIVLSKDQNGHVIAIDKQQQAIENTKRLLKENISDSLLNNVSYYNQCHSAFPLCLAKESVSLIVYNLGYLPRGDKNQTTVTSTTLQSLESALPLIASGGAISITCYPGHDAGKPEEEMVLTFTSSLNPHIWSCCHHRWINRRNAPSLILIQRGIFEE